MSYELYSPIIYDPISKMYYKQELNTHVGFVLNSQQKFVNKLIKQRDRYKVECDTLIDELEFAYKNWRAALSMGNSIADEKFKVDMENLKLREEIERLQNKLEE